MKKIFTLCATLFVSALSFAQNSIPGSIDLYTAQYSTTEHNEATEPSSDGVVRLNNVQTGTVVSFPIANSAAQAYDIAFKQGTCMSGITIDFEIEDASSQVVYSKQVAIENTCPDNVNFEIYTQQSAGTTPVLPVGAYTLKLYYNRSGNNGTYQGTEFGFTCNVSEITFTAAAAQSVSFDIDLSTLDASESKGGNLHYMADGDENCPRLDYPGAGSIGKFVIQIPQESAYKITFNYSSPMDKMFMVWTLTDANGNEVYNEYFPLEPTGAPSDYWTIYKDFDGVPVTPVLAAGTYTLRLYYNITVAGEVIPAWYDGSENAAFHSNIKRITFTSVSGGDTPASQELYSWKGAEGSAIEKGGSAVASDGESVNYKNTANEVDYYTIRLNGAKDFSTNVVTITIDNALADGDQIAITGYRNKNDVDKQSGALIKFDKGGEATTAQTGLEFVNLNPDHGGDQNPGTEPNTVTIAVPAEAAGSTVLTLTRAATQTNLFITEIQIIRGTTGIETVKMDGDGAKALRQPSDSHIYNLRGQRVDASYKGIVIINGKKYLQK